MGFLSAETPQMFTVSNDFSSQAALFRNTISQAEQSAMSAQAMHVGESGTAFQVGHAKFAEAAARINTLLDQATANIHEGGTNYVAQDEAAASDMTTAAGAIDANPM